MALLTARTVFRTAEIDAFVVLFVVAIGLVLSPAILCVVQCSCLAKRAPFSAGIVVLVVTLRPLVASSVFLGFLGFGVQR